MYINLLSVGSFPLFESHQSSIASRNGKGKQVRVLMRAYLVK